MITARATLAALALTSIMTIRSAIAKEFCFGVWGDMPYAYNGDITDTIDKAANVLDDMNQVDLAFSIFVGDIKLTIAKI